jgi:hypothetical protein
MMKREGSGSESGSISQRHGSPDLDPDPHQNVMDLHHWFFPKIQNIVFWQKVFGEFTLMNKMLYLVVSYYS